MESYCLYEVVNICLLLPQHEAKTTRDEHWKG